MYFFQRNFGERKVDVVTLLEGISMGQKVTSFSTYFFRHNFHGRKVDVILMYFLRHNFDRL